MNYSGIQLVFDLYAHQVIKFLFLLSMSQETAKMSIQNHGHLQNKLQHQKYICAQLP